MQHGKVDINFQLITITRTPANSDCCLLPLRVWFTRVPLYILVHIPKQKAEEITKICTCMHHFLTTFDIHYFSDREFIIYILKVNIIFEFIMKTFPHNSISGHLEPAMLERDLRSLLCLGAATKAFMLALVKTGRLKLAGKSIIFMNPA